MGELTIEIHQGAAPAESLAIRRRVFVEEQGVSEADEVDGRDAECTHFLARDAHGDAVGCARLRPYGDARKVERVAVVPEMRGCGLGRALMDAVEAHARKAERGMLVLHAQAGVVDFYVKLGWAPVDLPFDEAGIEHRRMEKSLGP